MNDHGVITEAGTIRFERLLPGPIERVWAYLTESDKRGKWLASGPLEQRVGGLVELRFHHVELSPVVEPVPERFKRLEDGAVIYGRVTRCQPPHTLSYTWGGETPENSEVTFELSRKGDKVLLVLTHRRLADRTDMVMVAGGWHAHLGILADYLEGVAPRPFWSAHARAEAEYERRIPG